jgi:hypothetical protein
VGKTWSLHLDLVSTANLYCGTLVVFRRYAQRNLQVDVNLLTSIFATSLADALHRSMTSSKNSCVAEKDAAFLQARAG